MVAKIHNIVDKWDRTFPLRLEIPQYQLYVIRIYGVTKCAPSVFPCFQEGSSIDHCCRHRDHYYQYYMGFILSSQIGQLKFVYFPFSVQSLSPEVEKFYFEIFFAFAGAVSQAEIRSANKPQFLCQWEKIRFMGKKTPAGTRLALMFRLQSRIFSPLATNLLKGRFDFAFGLNP